MQKARGIYKSYFFIEHDPILDQIDRLIELASIDAGRMLRMKHIAEKSGVGAATLYNWRSRKTKRPQNAAVQAVVRALGGEIVMMRNGIAIKAPRQPKAPAPRRKGKPALRLVA